MRVRKYTARKDNKQKCGRCGFTISKGDEYREMVVIDEDWYDKSYGRFLLHEHCIGSGDGGWYTEEAWAIRDTEEINEGNSASLKYIRDHYGLMVWSGTRVEVFGKGWKTRAGVAVKGDNYVYVRFDGGKRLSGPFHPSNVRVVEQPPAPAALTFGVDDGIPF